MRRMYRLVTALQLFPGIRFALAAETAAAPRLQATVSAASPNLASSPLSPCTGNGSTGFQFRFQQYQHPFHHFPAASMASTAGGGADSLKGPLSELDEQYEAQKCDKSEGPASAAPEAKNNGQAAPESKAAAAAAAEEPQLPKLTPAEFRAYNRLSDHMNMFHNHFRQTWKMMYDACANNKRPGGMSLKRFIDEGVSFVKHLEAHHGIEETYIFPLLAQKMPEFKNGKGNGAAELLRQHREIHKGMDGFEKYLTECRTGERELELSELKKQMDTWGTVLWTHLDQEVQTLRAENMRRYWTLDEVKRLPM